jgi:hypothetical protein
MTSLLRNWPNRRISPASFNAPESAEVITKVRDIANLDDLADTAIALPLLPWKVARLASTLAEYSKTLAAVAPVCNCNGEAQRRLVRSESVSASSDVQQSIREVQVVMSCSLAPAQPARCGHKITTKKFRSRPPQSAGGILVAAMSSSKKG